MEKANKNNITLEENMVFVVGELRTNQIIYDKTCKQLKLLENNSCHVAASNTSR